MSSESELSRSPKPEGSLLSFRPQRPVKKPVSSGTSTPTTPPTPTPTDSPTPLDASKEPPGVPFIELPTNESERVYTRSWFYAHKLSDVVEPDPIVTRKLREGQVWRSPQSMLSSGSSSSMTANPGRDIQHRERRPSSGPQRPPRSGSGTLSSGYSPLSNGITSSSSSGGLAKTNRSGSLTTSFSSGTIERNRDETPERRDSSAPRSGGRFVLVRNDANRFSSELTGLLNKLTVEKFEALSQQIARKFDAIDNAETLTEAIKLLHAKPIQEHSFCGMYADLVKQLDRVFPFEALEPSSAPTTPPPSAVHASAHPTPMSQPIATSRVGQIRASDMGFASSSSPLSSSPEFSRSISPARPRSDSTGSTGKPRAAGMLRKILLNCCFFLWQEATEGRIPLGEDEAAIKMRHRMNGNMIFMSELYKRGILPLKVLKSSAEGLIAKINEKVAPSLTPGTSYSTQQLEASASAEPLCVMLCHLVKTVGETLEKDVKQGKGMLENWIDAMKDIAANKVFIARVRFLVRDVIDDRLNDWRPRRRFEGPMKLDDVKELHEADQINPVVLSPADRIYVPTSEYDERVKRQAVSPARTRNAGSSQKSSGPGSGKLSKARSTSGGSSSSIAPIKEPASYSSIYTSSSPLATTPTEPMSPTVVPSSFAAGLAFSPGNGFASSPSDSSAMDVVNIEINILRSSSSSSSSVLAVFPKQFVADALDGSGEAPESLFDFFASHPSYSHSSFVTQLLNWVVDQSRKEQNQIAWLLSQLVSKQILNSEEIVSGFCAAIVALDDLIMDAPQAPTILGLRLKEITHTFHLTSTAQLDIITEHCPQKCRAKLSAALKID